jgi:ankyrin repeat protein
MTLPNELLLEVASHLETFRDLNSLVRTSRLLHAMFNTHLYRRAITADDIILNGILCCVLTGYRFDSLTLFLDNGLSVNRRTGRFYDNRRLVIRYWRGDTTMLRVLCRLDDQERSVPLARLLLQRGAHTGATGNIYSKTVLHEAASRGNCPIVELLLAHGADVNAENIYGLRALHFACNTFQDNPEVVNLLIAHGADIEACSTAGDTPLILSSRHHKPRIMAALLDHGADAGVHNNDGKTPLHHASTWFGSEHHELAKSLLEHGADVNATDNHGETPLHWLFDSLSGDRFFIAKFLLENGADVNALTDDELSPLQCAIESDCGVTGKSVIALLLQYGADVHATDEDGRAPLHWLLESDRNDKLPIAELLLEKGADVNALSSNGTSPLQCALFERPEADMIALLLEHGADVSVLDGEERWIFSQLMNAGEQPYW